MEKDNKFYRPLPTYLTIKQSGINGLGLFALENITLGTNMGMSHMKFNGALLRTPLGGFINHSNTPNCVKAESGPSQKTIEKKLNFEKWNLVAMKNIKEGDELTVKYTFYNMDIFKDFEICPIEKPKSSATVSEKFQEELEPIVNAPMMETE